MAIPSDDDLEKYFEHLRTQKDLADWQKQVIDMLTMPNPLLPSRPTAVEVQAEIAEARKWLQDKQDKFYQRYSSGTRNIKDQLNGKHRRPNPQAHSDPAKQPDPGDYGADQVTYYQSLFPGKITLLSPPKPRPIPYAGIRTGEIIGHRAWFVTPENKLCSFAHIYIWEPGAVITGDINQIVDDNWTDLIYGGVYAFANRHLDSTVADAIGRIHGSARTYLFPGDKSQEVIGVATGTIEMWGDVVEHQSGYRASHAKLHSLELAFGNCDVRKLRRIYNV